VLALVCCARALLSHPEARRLGHALDLNDTGQVSSGSSRMRGALDQDIGISRIRILNGLRLRHEATEFRRQRRPHAQDPARRAPQQPWQWQWAPRGAPRGQQSTPAPAHGQQRLFGEREEEAGRLEADGAGVRPMQGECALFSSLPLSSSAIPGCWVQCGAVRCSVRCSVLVLDVACCLLRATAKDSARIPTGRGSVARVARRDCFCDPPRRSCRVAKTVHRTVSIRVA
jgi:hypothetical protein